MYLLDFLGNFQECLRNFIISNMILKKGAKAGLTLYEIANVIYKEDPDEKSLLGQLINYAADLVKESNDYFSLRKDTDKTA